MSRRSLRSGTKDSSDPDWNTVPKVILYEVFKHLPVRDKLNASSSCKHWRSIIFSPALWHTMDFIVLSENEHNKDRVKFYKTTFGKRVACANVYFNSLNRGCLSATNKLLGGFKNSQHLKQLMLHPSHCSLSEYPHVCQTCHPLLNIIETCKNLERFSFGCLEEILTFINKFLKPLSDIHSQSIRVLGMASLKYDPDNYIIPHPDLEYFCQFINLEIVSIDYDAVDDVFLGAIRSIPLIRLIVHVHGVSTNHRGTSNASWENLRQHNPNFRVRMNLIHSYDLIDNFHTAILRPAMPLSHLRVFFCEKLNDAALRSLVAYSETLECLWWLDSFDCPNADTLIDEANPVEMNPFIFVSWRCVKLNELVLYGYKFLAEDVYAICRLRGFHLQNFKLASSNIVFTEDSPLDLVAVEGEVSSWLGKEWEADRDCQLHSVIQERRNGASDEYILPIVLKDLET